MGGKEAKIAWVARMEAWVARMEAWVARMEARVARQGVGHKGDKWECTGARLPHSCTSPLWAPESCAT